MNNKFYLAHITTKDNYESILKADQFRIGTHSPKNNLWLGDGVYFWDANDPELEKLGKELVLHKTRATRRSKIICMTKIVRYKKGNYINLENQEQESDFFDFLNQDSFRGIGIKLIQLFKVREDLNNITKEDMKLCGNLFGECINLYIKMLYDELGINIDIISYNFYSIKVQRKLFYENSYLFNKQFCIKNSEMLNNISKWEINEI